MRFKNSFVPTFIAVAALTFSSPGKASIIVASADSNLNLGGGQLSQFYHNMFSGQNVFAAGTGFTVTNTSFYMSAEAGSFTSANLSDFVPSNYSWLVLATDYSGGPGSTSYSETDLTTINNFAASGGNVFVIGEGTVYADLNAVGNRILGALSSTMTIGEPLAAAGSWTATSSDIASNNPLTAGISVFSGSYAATVSGGIPLFTSDTTGDAVVAEQTLTVLPVSFNSPATPTSVPEPATLMLFDVALGVTLIRRAKRLSR